MTFALNKFNTVGSTIFITALLACSAIANISNANEADTPNAIENVKSFHVNIFHDLTDDLMIGFEYKNNAKFILPTGR